MREKLNDNPMAQVALIGVLLVLAALFLLKPLGGGESEESAGGEATAASTEAAPVEGAAPITAAAPAGVEAGAAAAPAPLPPRPLPTRFMDAYDSGKTVVLLVVHDGGIDDRLVARSTKRLAAMSGVVTFIVPASKIARYASVTDGVGVNRVPALLVVRPKHLSKGQPTASVSYGFQGPQSLVQAVVDARYNGRTLDYHP